IENRNAVVVLVSDVESLLAIEGHRHRPGELPVARAKALTELSQILLIQIADAHTDGGGTRRVAPVQHENAPILAHGHIVGVSKTAPVEPIVDNTDGLDVFHRDGWRSGLSAHSSPPFPALPRILQHPRAVFTSAYGSISPASALPGSICPSPCPPPELTGGGIEGGAGLRRRLWAHIMVLYHQLGPSLWPGLRRQPQPAPQSPTSQGPPPPAQAPPKHPSPPPPPSVREPPPGSPP